MAGLFPEIHAMPMPSPHPRLSFSIVPVFLLGGAIGTGLNAAVLVLGHAQLAWPTAAACFAGTMANLLFHHVYYHLVFVNRDIKLRTPFWLQSLLYLLIAGGAAGAGWLLHDLAGLSLATTAMLLLGALAAANAVVNRIATFSSAHPAHVEYAGMGESFYVDQTTTDKVNFLRARYHRSRFGRLHAFIAQFYRPGMAVADLGCGNCLWNTEKVPVTGVDTNPRMLNWAKANGYLSDYRVEPDLSRIGLPKGAFDLVVMSEVLEHLLNLQETLAEVRSLLKDDGKLIITVPYDFFLGPFFILFNVNCLYQGYLRGSRYHRYRCGHVNHFTITRLRRSLAEARLHLDSVRVVNGLLLFAVATKSRP
jgi:SAM-dependent methyltransferase